MESRIGLVKNEVLIFGAIHLGHKCGKITEIKSKTNILHFPHYCVLLIPSIKYMKSVLTSVFLRSRLRNLFARCCGFKYKLSG